jgi:hypothetical protein
MLPKVAQTAALLFQGGCLHVVLFHNQVVYRAVISSLLSPTSL